MIVPLIVVPTYKEEDNIIPLLDEIFRFNPDVHVLFVDDNSPDRTREKIRFYAETKAPSQVYLLERTQKSGLGSAYRAGFAWALERDYQKVFEMDADLSHPASVLPQMIQTLDKWDFVVGSRYVSGGGVENWGFIRKMISRFGSLYARKILDMPIQDFTGGFNGWTREVLETIQVSQLKSEGYVFQIEIKALAIHHGFEGKEVPIVFVERAAGQSKMSKKIILEAMWRVWGIKAQLARTQSLRTQRSALL